MKKPLSFSHIPATVKYTKLTENEIYVYVYISIYIQTVGAVDLSQPEETILMASGSSSLNESFPGTQEF